MVFNSFAFAPFLAVAVGSQLLPLSWPARKACLIALSYLFYAAWYPLALLLLLASTLFDFHVAKALERSQDQRVRRGLMIGSVALNLGVLFSFKYLGFVVDNINHVLAGLGGTGALARPDWLLPVGISFYTFMSLSYVTDVYRRQREAEKSLLDFALFLSFFPHLVAGPIVRAEEFLPQCKLERRPAPELFLWGAWLLALGLFQKVVLADCWFAPVADRVFSASPAQLTTQDAWLGAIAFSGQIFCDFAGYSTCAIGAAACLGFQLPENFRSPYMAVGFSDFWRRWHISLSRWLRDYVYIGLGGNRRGPLRTWVNLLLTMLLGGLWHGASWTFVAWGALHGLFLCAERGIRHLADRWRIEAAPLISLAAGALTLLAVTWAWVFFRAPSLSFALSLTQKLFVPFGATTTRLIGSADAVLVVLAATGLLGAQRLVRNVSLASLLDRTPRPVLAVGLASLLIGIATMAGEDRAFIYFQF